MGRHLLIASLLLAVGCIGMPDEPGQRVSRRNLCIRDDSPLGNDGDEHESAASQADEADDPGTDSDVDFDDAPNEEDWDDYEDEGDCG